MTGEVIILTAPAAGKTTVAAVLAGGASVPTVHLTTDLFYRSIRTGLVLPFLPAAQRQNEVVIEAIVGTVATFARGGYDVVVDGILGPWFLPPFRAMAERNGLTMSYVAEVSARPECPQIQRPLSHIRCDQLSYGMGSPTKIGWK